MITKFKVYGHEITKVEAIKETKACVIINNIFGNERKEKKVSDYVCYVDTWKEAHDFLLSRSQKKLESVRLLLSRVQGEHGNIKGMKNPDEVSK